MSDLYKMFVLLVWMCFYVRLMFFELLLFGWLEGKC